jgi:NAD(P)-dependent dehydrogenase (short-subunit alcohol dehydrogenase family)
VAQIALVTGGSRGLGRNSALALAKKGIDVIVTYHSKREEAEAVVQQIEASGRKAAALQLDAGLISSFDGFVQELTGVLRDKWKSSSTA